VPVVLLATDADQLHDEVDASLGDEDTTVQRVRAGRDVIPAIKELEPDLVVLDLQIGNMGGMATCLSIRSEEGAGRLERRPVMMLLDRTPDVFLAKRADADGWLVKPLDSFRIRQAAEALLGGGEFKDSGESSDAELEPMNVMLHDNATPGNPAEPEQVPADLTQSAKETDTTEVSTDTVGVDSENAEVDEDATEAEAAPDPEPDERDTREG
jgi:DNA-binding response OmpR family regulator